MSFYPLNKEEKMWTKFAIEGLDNFSMFTSKDHFRLMSTFGHDLVRGNIGEGTYDSYIPKAGDVLQAKYNDYLYEIVSIKEEEMMVHLSKHYVWEFIVSPLKHEHLLLDAATSASIFDQSQISAAEHEDIFNIKEVLTSAVSSVLYQPEFAERDPRDPFGGW
jgi:hypothetical protein